MFSPLHRVLNDIDETIRELSVQGVAIKKYGRKIFRPYNTIIVYLYYKFVVSATTYFITLITTC